MIFDNKAPGSPWAGMYEQMEGASERDELERQVLKMLKDGQDIVDIGEFWEKSGRDVSDFFAFLDGLDDAERAFLRR